MSHETLTYPEGRMQCGPLSLVGKQSSKTDCFPFIIQKQPSTIHVLLRPVFWLVFVVCFFSSIVIFFYFNPRKHWVSCDQVSELYIWFREIRLQLWNMNAASRPLPIFTWINTFFVFCSADLAFLSGPPLQKHKHHINCSSTHCGQFINQKQIWLECTNSWSFKLLFSHFKWERGNV